MKLIGFMIDKNVLQRVRDSVGSDEIGFAIKSLIEILGKEKRKNEVILLQRQYVSTEKKHNLNQIKYEEYSRIKNQISGSLLSIIDDIEEFISNREESIHIDSPQNEEISLSPPFKEEINQTLLKLKSVRYNVMIIGKAGVGKTSLINYLYGDNVGKTGVGISITKGFVPIDIIVNNQNIRIYDTEGLSAGSAAEWKTDLRGFLSEHGLDTPASNWLHTIFYCFHVGGSRIEKFEIDIIKELINQNYRITIVFSKADQGGQEDLVSLSDTLEFQLDEKLTIIPVCSIKGKTRLDGTTINQFGKDKLENQLSLDFWKSICTRLPLRCEYLAIELIELWEKEQHNEIRRLVKIEDDLNAIVYKLKSETDSFTKDLKEKIIKIVGEEIEITMALYDAFADALGYPVDKLQKLGSLNLDVRFNTYEKATVATVAARVLDLNSLFEDFDYYKDNLFDEFKKLTVTPKSRENELLRNLRSVSSKLKTKIKGGYKDESWPSILEAMNQMGMGKGNIYKIKNKSSLSLKHIVAESLIEVSPFWDMLEYE